MSRTMLLIQSNPQDAKFLWGLLSADSWNVVYAPTGAAALGMLDMGHRPDAVLCAGELPDCDMRDLLHQIHERFPGAAVATTEVDGADVPYAGNVVSRPFGQDKLRAAFGEGK